MEWIYYPYKITLTILLDKIVIIDIDSIVKQWVKLSNKLKIIKRALKKSM